VKIEDIAAYYMHLVEGGSSFVVPTPQGQMKVEVFSDSSCTVKGAMSVENLYLIARCVSPAGTTVVGKSVESRSESSATSTKGFGVAVFAALAGFFAL